MFKIPLVNSLWMASRMSLKLFTPSSCFHATASTQLKEIRTNKVGNTLIIEGINVPSPRENYLIPNDGKSCPLARLNLNVKHTDVLILSQFVRPDGCMLPQRITGLSKIKQKKITKLVSMAHKAGLMCSLAPENSKKDPTRRKHWKKYNTYFDESTIKVFDSRVAQMKTNMLQDYIELKKQEKKLFV